MSGPSIEPQQALTPKQVAALEQLSPDAIYRAIYDGDLVARKVCRRLRIDPADYDVWKHRHRVNPSPGPMLSPVPPAAVPGPSARGRSRGRFLEELDAIEERGARGA